MVTEQLEVKWMDVLLSGSFLALSQSPEPALFQQKDLSCH